MDDYTNNVGVFISHHTNSSFMLVEELSNILTAFDITHWYAERDIGPMENYTAVIPQVIQKSTLLVLLLNKDANISQQVLREVQYALKWKIPVMIARLDDCEENSSIAYIGSTEQYVDLRGLNRIMAAQTLGTAINERLNGQTSFNSEEKSVFQSERSKTMLEFYGDEGERNRLRIQRQLIYDFAADCYDDFLTSMHSGSFLDVGCNTAEQSMMFIEGRKEITHYIGIDREAAALEKAKMLYPEGHFYQADCENDDLDEKLSSIEDELGIDGFDIINLSMIVLHLKQPRIVLDVLRSHLSENGRFVILDIDDGFNIAYPDEDGNFRKAVDICAETGYSGYRKSGRQICQLLNEVELDNILLHKNGLSTVGMSRTKRGELFDIYFWFILDDLRKMHEESPSNKIVASQLAWFENVYKDMKAQFKRKDFFFSLGFMLFSAT